LFQKNAQKEKKFVYNKKKQDVLEDQFLELKLILIIVAQQYILMEEPNLEHAYQKIDLVQQLLKEVAKN